MTTRNLPDSDAARHGTGDADLTIMLAAHGALRRDLERLALAADFANLPDPGGRASVRAGWETFKRQLHLHHTAEDMVVWPALRRRLPASDDAEWRGVGFKIVRQNGLSAGGEMFAWLADGADADQAAAVIGTLPPHPPRPERPCSGLEAVAHARLGEQIPGPGRLGLQLAAQLGDIDPQVVGLRPVGRPPHVLQ